MGTSENDFASCRTGLIRVNPEPVRVELVSAHMKTPILMTLLLLLPYGVVRLVPPLDRRGARPYSFVLGLALLFCFTSSGHFVQTAAMAQMLPPWVPARVALVYLTGVLEFVAAVLILLPRTRRPATWAMLAMLILFLPANIYAALERVPMGGHAWGPVYLLVRVPLQLLIVAVCIRVLRSAAPTNPPDDAVQTHRREPEMSR